MNKKYYYIVLSCLLILPAVSFGQNNIIPSTQDCSSTITPFTFDIKPARWSSTRSDINDGGTPLAGDLDGDGVTEVLALTTVYSLVIFDGRTGAEKGIIPNIAHYPTPITLCDVEGDGKVEILAVSQQTVTLYEISSYSSTNITYSIRWSRTIASISNFYNVQPFTADLDADGYPEFIVGYSILDRFGSVKATIPLGSKGLFNISYGYAADVDADKIPEVIAGTDVYKYDGATLTLWRRCPGFTAGVEGTNIAADINLDGVVDLVYHDNESGTGGSGVRSGQIIVWTPSTGEVIGKLENLNSVSRGRSYTVVGDIDGKVEGGKKYPEICFNGYNMLYAYKYTGSGFAPKWQLPTNENSGLATFTFFDFNSDDVVELVYRDERWLHIYNGAEDNVTPQEKYNQNCMSWTGMETPIVADVTGDGSANIIVTGSGKVHVFEGQSKWASCPNVWNQQLYSPLLINRDLTVISEVSSPAWNMADCHNEYPRYYNGGPMQVPLVSEETFCPIHVSPDLFIVSGEITISGSTANISVVVGNQGLAVAPANSPIRFYKNSIAPANILTMASTTLGVDLAVGQTHTITKTITGLSPMPTQFYVRLVDDGEHFLAQGPFSDCNITNNTKAFGTLELFKTANSTSACTDGTSIFYIDLVNNTDQLGTPTNYSDIVLIDSLGTGWEFLTATSLQGSLGTYNPATRKLEWTIPVLDAGETARLIITAKATSAGSIRNTAWIQSVSGTTVGQEAIEAYVVVNSTAAPAAASISPLNPQLCDPSGVTLTASVAGAASYQWYLGNVEISGAVGQSHTATVAGSYTVTYFDGTCVSQMSAPVVVNEECMTVAPDVAEVSKLGAVVIDVLANDDLGNCTAETVTLTINSTPSRGTAVVENQKITYTAYDNIGTDSFSYKVRCGSLEKTATVTVTINSTLMVKKHSDPSEPNKPGAFLVTYTDSGFTYHRALKVHYQLSGTAVCNQDFLPPNDFVVGTSSGFIVLPASSPSIQLTITPSDNYKVEGNSRTVEVTITDVEVM